MRSKAAPEMEDRPPVDCATGSPREVSPPLGPPLAFSSFFARFIPFVRVGIAVGREFQNRKREREE